MSDIVDGSSQSLVIAEGKADFQINSSQQKVKPEDDLFELSQDQPSDSFRIQEQSKNIKVRQLCRQSKDDTLVLNVEEVLPEEPKKKRKEIFSKFKKYDHSVPDKAQQSGPSNLLNIFDSIFSKKPNQPANFCGVYDKSQSFDPRQPILLDVVSSRSRTPSAERRARLKIFEKNKKVETFNAVLPDNILEDNKSNKPEEQAKFDYGSPIKGEEESFLSLSTLQKRISGIQMNDGDVSRDSFEINTILQSQLFKDEKERIKPLNQVVNNQNTDKVQAQMKNIPTGISQQQQSIRFTKKEAIEVQSEKVQQQISNMPLSIAHHNQQRMVSLSTNSDRQVNNMQIQQSQYLNEGTSSLSSTPSVFVHDYDSHKHIDPFTFSNVNLDKKVFQYKNDQVEIKQNPSDLMVQSKIVEDEDSLAIKHMFEEEERLPKFIRKSRQLISIYPNFYILKDNPNTLNQVNGQFMLLLEEVKKAIDLLGRMCQKILEYKAKKQLYLEQMMNDISLQSFMDINWAEINQVQQYQLIRPNQPIQMRPWSFQKAKTALANYQSIVSHYKAKGIRVYLSLDKGKKKYFDIRQKFWDICGNMKLISEDIYCQFRKNMFPSHYREFQQFLKSPKLNRVSEERLNEVMKLRNTFRHLKMQNDVLVSSRVGSKIMQRMQMELTFLNPY